MKIKVLKMFAEKNSCFDNLRADFLSSLELLVAILSQKKSIIQELTVNILMRISIGKIVCECFLP